MASATNHTGTIRSHAGDPSQWDWIDGPELGLVEIDPDLPQLIFSSSGGGPVEPQPLKRSTDGGLNWITVTGPVWGVLSICPNDTQIMLAGSVNAGEVLMSFDHGKTWKTINDASGAPLKLDSQTLASCSWQAIGKTAFVGTGGGRLWRYSGPWEEFYPPLSTQPIAPGIFRRLQAIGTHPIDPNILYVGYSGQELMPVWRGVMTGPGQFQWTNASGMYPNTSLPAAPIIKIIVDPWNSMRVFVASAVGVFVSEDEGQWWKPLMGGMPNVTITDMRLHVPSKRLIISTWGRGIFQSFFELGDGFDPMF